MWTKGWVVIHSLYLYPPRPPRTVDLSSHSLRVEYLESLALYATPARAPHISRARRDFFTHATFHSQ